MDALEQLREWLVNMSQNVDFDIQRNFENDPAWSSMAPNVAREKLMARYQALVDIIAKLDEFKSKL